VVAKHSATAEQAGASSKRARVGAVAATAGTGSSGEKVRLLQILLRRLAYVAPLSGKYSSGTARGVLAFRKVNHMSRSGGANRAIFRKLFAGQGGFKLRYPKAGKHVEADLSMAVLVLAQGGKPRQIYTTSPGKPSTPTVRGAFRFYRKSPGTNSHGMVHSSYFHGGYAIHGYASVPPYPASHGCLRVPIPDARRIYDQITLGEQIFVYS
jgi:peptidoglycan hydrolase-like protein with peptidoglycan-binding domain